MIELGSLVILRPLWLLGLPLLALAALVRRPGHLGVWARATDPALLAAMSRLGFVSPATGTGRWAVVALVAVLLAALAGPAVQREGSAGYRNLDGLVLVMDLSRSVAGGENLGTATAAARTLLSAAGDRPVALVVYGGSAYQVSPLTTDARALDSTVAALDGETVPDPGTCLGCALDLALMSITDSDLIAADVVLFSDGGGAGLVQEQVGSLREAGARLSTVFVPPVARPAGMPAPDRAALAALADAGGGRAVEAAEAVDLQAIAAGQGYRANGEILSTLSFGDYGRHLLVLALPLALMLLRRPA